MNVHQVLFIHFIHSTSPPPLYFILFHASLLLCSLLHVTPLHSILLTCGLNALIIHDMLPVVREVYVGGYGSVAELSKLLV